MRAIPYTTAKKNLEDIMKQVCDDHNPIIITRKNYEAVVLMPLRDYEAMAETAYLLQSPNNSKRLMDSIHELSERPEMTEP